MLFPCNSPLALTAPALVTLNTLSPLFVILNEFAVNAPAPLIFPEASIVAFVSPFV